MDTQKAKETIITYIQQFETDKAVGMVVNRSRRELLRRVFPYNVAKQAYSELIQEREIHEIGNGFGNTPIIVALGPPPTEKIDPASLPFPYMHIDTDVIQAFMIHLVDVYMSRSWGTPDLRSEINKALTEYQPKRPY